MSVKILFCYAHEDIKWLNELKKHLDQYKRTGTVEIWHDADISAGVEWEPEIAKQLNDAHIILLLISVDFVASDYCYNTELKRAIERHERKEARVIPIIIRSVSWKKVESLKKLQALPRNGKAVAKWSNKDSAFEEISDEIAGVIEELSIHASLKVSKQSQQEHVKTEVNAALPNISQSHDTSVPLRRKQALLILAGGRALPDILTVLYLQPQLVIVLIPQEGWSFEQIFVDMANTLPFCEVKFIRNIDAFDIEASMKACVEACLPYPDSEWMWTFTTTSSTKILSLAAYECAKQKDIPCLQVDMLHEKVISLVKKKEVDVQRFFYLTIDQYIKNHGYTTVNNKWTSSGYESKLTAWSGIARELVYSSDTETFQQLLRVSQRGETINIALPPEMKTATLLQSLESNGLLEIKQQNNHDTVVSLSHDGARFLMGDWLSFYVWQELIRAGFANDCRWGLRIAQGKVQFEIDLALIHKARLLIAECKSDQFPFKDDYLTRLDAPANMLGGSYVSKVFITNQYGTGNRFQSFCERARARKIIVVTKEDLPVISDILKREMTNSTYVRI